MNLADKPVYPENEIKRFYNEPYIAKSGGLTYKEWLVGMLASNPNLIITFQGNDDRYYPDVKLSAEMIEMQADELIKRLEKQ